MEAKSQPIIFGMPLNRVRNMSREQSRLTLGSRDLYSTHGRMALCFLGLG